MKNTGQVNRQGRAGTAGFDIGVVPVWNKGITGSRNIRVAIIDTGIDYNHPNLKANVEALSGYDFANDDADAMDDNDHGTHCAGTIGANGNQGLGVAGVNWQVTMIPVKFLTADGGGSLDDAVDSINWAREKGVHIMSNSWGGGGFSVTMKDAIEKARDAGILFVAAAGNSSNDNDSTPSYPSNYDVSNVLAVAATGNRDDLASFSSYGKTKVHVAAPGVDILSTTKGGKYSVFSGTSMATPHVAGAAALLMSADSTMTAADLKDRLIRTSDYAGGLRRRVASAGRINVNNALLNIVPEHPGLPNEADWQKQENIVESAHPYENNANLTYTVKKEGAKFMRIHFEKIVSENGYDIVSVETPSGEVIDTYSGNRSDITSDFVTGDTVIIRFKTDSSATAWGFKVDRLEWIAE
jgi:subtilisin family serine protease